MKLKNMKTFEQHTSELNISNVSDSKINELFGIEGSVDIKIEGQGHIREVVLDILRKSLKGINGDVNLYFGNEKVHL